MTVKELKQILEKENENAQIYVGCEGYTNYDKYGICVYRTNHNQDILITDCCGGYKDDFEITEIAFDMNETLLYEILKGHIGHTIEIVEYGDGINISLEDVDTSEVIFDTDVYDLIGR